MANTRIAANSAIGKAARLQVVGGEKDRQGRDGHEQQVEEGGQRVDDVGAAERRSVCPASESTTSPTTVRPASAAAMAGARRSGRRHVNDQHRRGRQDRHDDRRECAQVGPVHLATPLSRRPRAGRSEEGSGQG